MTFAPLLASSAKVESVMLHVLMQLVVIIAVARLMANLARRIGQPAVVGEIAAGLLLGPSALGALSAWLAHDTALTGGRDLAAILFNKEVNDIFVVLAQLGVVLMLFLVGLEFDYGHLRSRRTAATAITAVGTVVPFALGLILAPVLLPEAGLTKFGTAPDPTAFSLFLGTALSITAIPVLASMMSELNITRTRVGTVTMAAAGAGDAVGWILLATVAGVAKARTESGEFSLATTGGMAGWTTAFVLFVVFVVRPLMARWIAATLRRNNGDLGADGLTVVLAAVFLCAIATNLIGIFSIFGAFFLGAALSGEPGFRQAVSRVLGRVTTVFLLPIFFTYTGLRTNVGSLDGAGLWLLSAAVCAAAFVGKFGGCALAARLSGFSLREAGCIGAMMNARGLMELIVINEGYNLGVLTGSTYCMLVVMAMISNVLTIPSVVRLAPGTELERPIAESDFAARRSPAPEPEPAPAP